MRFGASDSEFVSLAHWLGCCVTLHALLNDFSCGVVCHRYRAFGVAIVVFIQTLSALFALGEFLARVRHLTSAQCAVGAFSMWSRWSCHSAGLNISP